MRWGGVDHSERTLVCCSHDEGVAVDEVVRGPDAEMGGATECVVDEGGPVFVARVSPSGAFALEGGGGGVEVEVLPEGGAEVGGIGTEADPGVVPEEGIAVEAADLTLDAEGVAATERGGPVPEVDTVAFSWVSEGGWVEEEVGVDKEDGVFRLFGDEVRVQEGPVVCHFVGGERVGAEGVPCWAGPPEVEAGTVGDLVAVEEEGPEGGGEAETFFGGGEGSGAGGVVEADGL